MAQESNACCAKGYRPIKSEESRDQKDFKAKKNYNSPINNSNSGSGNRSQSNQALGWFFKKNFCSNYEGQ